MADENPIHDDPLSLKNRKKLQSQLSAGLGRPLGLDLGSLPRSNHHSSREPLLAVKHYGSH